MPLIYDYASAVTISEREKISISNVVSNTPNT
jgi:hypothetical protein